MAESFPLITSFLVSFWLEGVLYGFFVCIFATSLIVNVGSSNRQTAHSRAMFVVGIVTFLLATAHVVINFTQMMRGYADHSSLAGGPVGYLAIISQWDSVLKNVIYTTQSIVGDSVAVYRCWVLWNRNFFVICAPLLMVFGSTVSGYMTCVLLGKIQPGMMVIGGSPQDAVVKTFFSLAVAQNVITTSLMAWRIAATNIRSSSYRIGQTNFMPMLRILVESAALYLAAEIVLLILYVCDSNAQFIVLEAVTPIIGITFNVMTIRITLCSQPDAGEPGSANHHETIGSTRLRRITVNITHTMEVDCDAESQTRNEDGLKV
ncbi:hypothetical protein C8R47DRAFT_146651 [Mycena vitilis]|nr:hypothetical protein C8R47DRAFT_146651 [Mycena vitilis]